MEIVLQNKRTLDFVKEAGGWTPRREKARVFGNGLEAIVFCFDHRIINMQILGQFADPRMNFAVSVTDHRGG